MTATPTPKAPPTPLPGLAAFLAPLLLRPSTRESAERYCTGLLTDLPHKTCDGIAAAVAGTTTKRLQHLLTDADWDPLALDAERVRLLVEATPAGGVLAIDPAPPWRAGTTFPKQGTHSVGVAHQWCGVFGTQANCQALVTAEYVVGRSRSAPAVHWPVSARLYLPDSWVHDEPRRRRAHVPAGVPKLSKIEIALELVDRAVAWGVPFRLVTADAAYGHFRDFFGGLDDRGLLYACAVKESFGVRRPDEVRAARDGPPPPRKPGAGRKPKRHPAPLYRVDRVVAALPPEAWEEVTWREGERGPMRRRFTALRMHWGKRVHLGTASSRTARPAWPPAEEATDGLGTLRVVGHDDPAYEGWTRLALVERWYVADPDRSYGPPVEEVTVFAGAVALPVGVSVPPGAMPFTDGDPDGWWGPGPMAVPSAGPLVTLTRVTDWLGDTLLIVPPVWLRDHADLRPATLAGSLAWCDLDGNEGVTLRTWWVRNPEGLFAEPAVCLGSDLVVRPDISERLSQICRAPLRELRRVSRRPVPVRPGRESEE